MSITIFSADDGHGGFELWESDGTTGRTSLILDINPGAASSSPSNIGGVGPFASSQSFLVHGGVAYFAASDGTHGTQLWRSDGSAAGTYMLSSFGEGVPGPTNITYSNGYIMVVAPDPADHQPAIFTINPASGQTIGEHGIPAVSLIGPTVNEWFYWIAGGDGGESGLMTYMGGVGVQRVSSNTNYTTLLAAGDDLYAASPTEILRVRNFNVQAGITGWTGTPVNFVSATGGVFFETQDKTKLYDIKDGATATLVASGLQLTTSAGSAAALGNKLIFLNTDAAHGQELWISDGTGAQLLKDTLPGPAVEGRTILNLTTAGNLVFFESNDGRGGSDLWRTDGSVDGTFLLKHVSAGNPDRIYTSPPPSLHNLTAQDGILYFSADDGLNGTELWRSDGTALGTVRIDVNTAVQDVGVQTGGYADFAALGNLVLFTGFDLAHGYQLWRSDGTSAGTGLVAAAAPGIFSAAPRFATAAGGQVFFAGADTAHGYELWSTDGTASGTHLVSDIAAGVSSSDPARLAAFGNSVLFTADDGVHGITPWISTGTAAGTFRLSDTNVAGFASTTRPMFIVAGDKAYFSGDNGNALWVTDGTAAGTYRLYDSGSSTFGNGLSGVVIGSEFYFTGADGGTTQQLYKTDGTVAGTQMVKQIITPGSGRMPVGLTDLNGKLAFFADATPFSYQLYVSDGTAAGTHTVGSTVWTIDQPTNVTASGGKLFFLENTSASGSELWVSDGTTVTQIDIFPGAQSSSPASFTAFNNKLFFTARDTAAHGTELWVSDGTLAGTQMLKDINPTNNAGSSPTDLVVAGSQLFFFASDGTHGSELWVSDGSAAGTHMVLDIAPGANPSVLAGSLRAAGSHVEFFANDGVHGTELWISDGTVAGTFMATDAQNSGSSSPSGFTSLPGSLDTGPETLNGTANIDLLSGGAGGDTLNGLAGDDVLTGGAGNDTIDGGDGHDVAIYSGTMQSHGIAYNAGTGVFTVIDNNPSSPDGTDSVRNVEQFRFSDGTIDYDLSGAQTWWSTVTMRDASGSIQRVTVTGDNGVAWSNYVDTANASPLLWSSTAFDANGNAVEMTSTNDDGTHTLQLFDVANAYGWANATISYDANWNVTGVTGTHDDASGGVTMAELIGAFDTLAWFTHPFDPDFYGAPSNQTLTGGSGVDVLYGFGGDDVLDGSGGNDILDGGTGNDTLTGGAGNDIFVFHPGDGYDVITDFKSIGSDVIDLRAYGLANFAALQALMTQSNSDTVITFDADNHIVLPNLSMAQLAAGDFLLS